MDETIQGPWCFIRPEFLAVAGVIRQIYPSRPPSGECGISKRKMRRCYPAQGRKKSSARRTYGRQRESVIRQVRDNRFCAAVYITLCRNGASVRHSNELALDRCPHCSIAHPRIARIWAGETTNHKNGNPRYWSTYGCGTCGGVVLAVAPKSQHGLGDITHIWPAQQVVPEELPERAKSYLSQAISSLHAPVGAVITAASAVDAMLKSKGYREGSLYSRIDAAAAAHVITQDMAAWAHEIRLEANDQRHADEDAPLPTATDAERVLEFAQALGQFLFVLPARVARGRGNAA